MTVANTSCAKEKDLPGVSLREIEGSLTRSEIRRGDVYATL